MSADRDEFRIGNTRNGVEQMLGNAAEWTASLAIGYRAVGTWNGHNRVNLLIVMGGGFGDKVVHEYKPNNGEPTLTSDQIGFRCVSTR